MDCNSIRNKGHHYFPQKSKTERGKSGLSSEGVALLKYISSMGLKAYKTSATPLQILLTLPVLAASCEHSFSKMKLIKSICTLHCHMADSQALLQFQSRIKIL
jgi:hypothetical protein